MTPVNNSNRYVPPQRRSSRQVQERCMSTQIQEQRPAQASAAYEEHAQTPHTYGSISSRPEPAHSIRLEVSQGRGTEHLASAHLRPSSAPREPKAMRPRASSRGKKKVRTFPELQSADTSAVPQNKFDQAVVYTHDVVKKVADAVLMMPPEPGWTKPVTHRSNNGRLPPYSILEQLQKNREEGYSSLHSRIQPSNAPVSENGDTVRREEERHPHSQVHDQNSAPQAVASTPECDHRMEQLPKRRVHWRDGTTLQPHYKSTVDSPHEQELVTAMQGLKVFEGLSYDSRCSKPSAVLDKIPSAMKQARVALVPETIVDTLAAGKVREGHLDKAEDMQLATENDGAKSMTLRERHTNKNNIQHSLPLEIEAPISTPGMSLNSEEPQDAMKYGFHSTAKEIMAATKIDEVVDTLVAKVYEDERRISSEATKEVASSMQETVLLRQDALAETTGSVPFLEPTIAKSTRESKAQDLEFEDVDLGSPATPETSESSDDDFERIDSKESESNRNGQPGVWGRWVQGKK